MLNLNKIAQQTFEDIKIIDETGFEFWSVRELMLTLGYVKWQKFVGVIEKAKIACQNSGQEASNHFLPKPVKTLSLLRIRHKSNKY